MPVRKLKSADDFAPSHAIIDIGSNTVRLVVYGGPPRAPVILFNEKVNARLGRSLAGTGKLSAKAVSLALAALVRFHALLTALAVARIDTVATAAVRDASDGEDFLEKVRAIGLTPRLLSGEQEAEASAVGVMGAFPGATGVVADLGGGSLELVDIDAKGCRHGVSIPFGTLRLPGLRLGGEADFGRKFAKALNGAGWGVTPGCDLFLVGGSLRSLAKYAINRSTSPLDDPHAFEIEPALALRLAQALSRQTVEQIGPERGISSSRLASLPDAAALLVVALEQLRPARLVFSSWGLREGIMFDALPTAVRAQDPLLTGIAAFAAHRGVSTDMAARVSDWTAAVLHPPGTPDEVTRIRQAAILLALASAGIEPNLRSQMAADWALRKRLIGIRGEQRFQLAAAIMANAGRTDFPEAWAPFASPESIRQAQAWGLAVRLCRRFAAFAPPILTRTVLARDERLVTLTVAQPLAALVSDGTKRDLKLLGESLGLKSAIVVEG